MMAGRKKADPSGPCHAPRKMLAVPVKSNDPDEVGRAHGRHHTSGAFAALRVVRASEKSAGYDLDLPGLLATLEEQAKAVNAGSLEQAEAMLMNQATALQTVFARLAERGMSCTEAVPFETNMRIALRAQSQCRATLETLAAIKNPSSVAFVRQANIAHGPQQINNGPIPTESSRAREIESERIKLSGGSDELLPDARASVSAGRANPRVEAVGAIHGAEIG